MERNLIRCGEYIKDVQTEEKDGYRRIRIIKYDEELYFHHMFNGEVIECVKLS